MEAATIMAARAGSDANVSLRTTGFFPFLLLMASSNRAPRVRCGVMDVAANLDSRGLVMATVGMDVDVALDVAINLLHAVLRLSVQIALCKLN
jgi:hypothetical protein